MVDDWETLNKASTSFRLFFLIFFYYNLYSLIFFTYYEHNHNNLQLLLAISGIYCWSQAVFVPVVNVTNTLYEKKVYFCYLLLVYGIFHIHCTGMFIVVLRFTYLRILVTR